MVDEMDLLGRLGEVEPGSSEAIDRAELILRAAIAAEVSEEAEEPVPARSRRHRRVAVRGALGAGIAAAAAAVALIATSTTQPLTISTRAKVAAPATSHSRDTADHSPKVSAGSNHESPLIHLADYVSKSAAPTGDATLVARTTALGGGKSVTVYDLYTDNGQYFFSQIERGLAGQISTDNNQAGGLFAREIAAAKLAATGNVQTAGEDMATAPDPSNYVPQTTTQTLSGANAAKEPGLFHAGEVIGTDYDNYVWENSQDALIAGSGDPQVRAGVLRLLATLPDVTVTSGTSAGQPTLVLTAGTDETGDIEQLTINATTGIPMSSASGTSDQTLASAVTYQVSRVTTSDIAAGKF